MEGEMTLLGTSDVEAEKGEELGDPSASFEPQSCTTRGGKGLGQRGSPAPWMRLGVWSLGCWLDGYLTQHILDVSTSHNNPRPLKYMCWFDEPCVLSTIWMLSTVT